MLKDIWLSFLPGAKIGVLGVNGAGKSTLLKIMAGVDKEFVGEAWAAEGAKVGYLPQEPQLDPDQGRAPATSRRGWARSRRCSTRFEEVSAQLRRGARRRRDERADRRAGRAAGEDRRRQRLGARPHRRDRHGRAALPARRRRCDDALGRREAPRRALPAAAATARPAAARRADQPSRRRIGRLAGALPRRTIRARS